ncbi:histidine phosphatase family protein [Granulicella mallensis]|jgi:broad specificity phosphatase PhoE|uniref:Putative phosphoglycerate mutase n=1 Tax=Granulicella mallensis TaxID=940614 RepID=A0A7W7ZQK9_9BACT|nr:histidine phosphatase family protein [Granulicella mallensis]MBB5064314.1 putative phosphoglycerate mutase [Granulicella mallensis]
MPEEKTELWLVRHGETEWSLDGRHTSWTDIPLTDHGRQRAVELREFLAGKKFAAVFVSPRQRARETCEIAGYGDVAVIEDGLQEWNYGESEGKTTAQMRAIHGPNWSVWTDPIIGGESVEAVGERADGVIAKALAAAPQGGAVALFAHAHILRILAARWIGLPAVGGKLFGLGTGSVSVLGHERETRVISRWNRGFETE